MEKQCRFFHALFLGKCTIAALLHRVRYGIRVCEGGGKSVVLDVGAVLGDGRCTSLEDEDAAHRKSAGHMALYYAFVYTNCTN